MITSPSSSERVDSHGNTIHTDNAKNFSLKVDGKNNTVQIANRQPDAKVNVRINGDQNQIKIGKCILKNFTITIGSHLPVCGAKIFIGDNFSIEPGGVFEVYTDFGEVHIGEKCLFSRNITIHFGDSPHLIFDKTTGEYRDGDGHVEIGCKVWVGEGCYLSKRAIIPEECIVAARSVVTRKFDTSHCVIGGNPARITKNNIQWFRNRNTIGKAGPYSAAIMQHDSDVEKKVETLRSHAEPEQSWSSLWQSDWPQDATLLFGVGAMKAGTSWLHDYLASHPDVHFSPVKEVHYFDVLESRLDRHHLNSKIDSIVARLENIKKCPIEEISNKVGAADNALDSIRIYENSSGAHEIYRYFLLKKYKNQKIVGDITPSYCALPEARLEEMYNLAPSVKFLFVMREPIDRLWSAIRMRAKQIDGNFEALCLDLAKEVIATNNHPMLSRSDYRGTVENLDSVAERDDVLFLFYENMFHSDSIDNLCDFLGIERKAGSDSKKVNSGVPSSIPTDIAEKLFDILKPQYDFVMSRFGELVPDEWGRF